MRALLIRSVAVLLIFAGVYATLEAWPDGQTVKPEQRRPTDSDELRRKAYTAEVLRARRERMMQALPAGTVVILGAAKSPRQDYLRFNQGPDFLYLTGLNHPRALVLMVRGEDKVLALDSLFLPHRNRRRELWEGPSPSVESETADKLGFSALGGLEDFGPAVNQALKQAKGVQLGGLGMDTLRDYKVEMPENLKVANATTAVAPVRLIKDQGEIALLERAIDITCSAQIEAMQSIRPGHYEYELQAVIEYIFKRYGATGLAFNSICGSGPNTCVLHYGKNRRRMADGDLVVVDVGARFHGYCADVTRTLPINGRFSKRQREIYEVVLKAQQAAIDTVRPGVTLRDVHMAARKVISDAGYARYFPHGTSHWLGLEVHDTPYAPRGVVLKPGMVLTVEPGIYIADESLGVRIEDDVVVTKTGSRVLSASAPRTVAEIEALMKSRRGVGNRFVTPLPLRSPFKTPFKSKEGSDQKSKKSVKSGKKRRLH